MDKWNEISFLINKHKEKNTSEEFFQNEIENIFEKLGWSRYRKEIISKHPIRVGAVNTVIPDIVINNNEENVIVVELKKSSQISLPKYIEQLTSYMRLLKLDYGIFIGDNLEIYYDEPTGTDEPIKVFEIDFHENNENGNVFLELITKDNFSKDVLKEFCNDRLEQITDKKIALTLLDELKSDDGVSKILSYLIEDLSNDYNENIVKSVLENLSIKVDSKNGNESLQKQIVAADIVQEKVIYTTSEKLPIEIIPNDVEEFKRQFIELGYAKLCYHYTDGTVKEKIWNKRAFSEKANLKANLRSRPEARKGKWKEMGIVKLVCKIDN
ncbi:type I restriction enzyme HsdR N-terminal domain-containing protein [Carboxylicivirga sp. M1479]|uniref:type I restriction enzyme HsdR N-terminal domain-containing protein n=1 Tax=Carboxylicivirga sp. M1479 TaxID=2594476 RepID=UPI00117852E5|nr:type I restriction enzyme HsdR N-terminal domain-containing protein [Carboxylicivirga sp. M1479]TRX65910.1 GxxExxY protein [Carboxylicivirga sp. M1479]